MSNKRLLPIFGAIAALVVAATAWLVLAKRSGDSPRPEAPSRREAARAAVAPAEPEPAAAEPATEPLVEEPSPEPTEVAKAEKPKAEPAEDEPAKPWTFRVRVRARDALGNPAPESGSYELAAFSTTGQKLGSALFEAGKEGVVESPFWPSYVAVSGIGPSMMMARGSFDLPIVPPDESKAWKGSGDVVFDDVPVRRAQGFIGEAVGRWRNNGQPAPPPQVAFEFDTVPHAAPRFPLAELEEVEAVDPAESAARSIDLELSLAVAYCGDIEATVANLATQELLVALQSAPDQAAFAAEHGALTVSLLRRAERTDGGSLVDRPMAKMTTTDQGSISSSQAFEGEGIRLNVTPNISGNDYVPMTLAGDEPASSSTQNDPLSFFDDGFEAVRTVSLDRPWRPQPREEFQRGGQGGQGGQRGRNEGGEQGNRWNRGDRENRRGGDQGPRGEGGQGGGRFGRRGGGQDGPGGGFGGPGGPGGGEGRGGRFNRDDRRGGERAPDAANASADASAGDATSAYNAASAAAESPTGAQGAGEAEANRSEAAADASTDASAAEGASEERADNQSDAQADASAETAEAQAAETAEAPAAEPVEAWTPRELVAGSEPNAYRQAQRAMMMEQEPRIDGNRVSFSKVPPGQYVVEVRTSLGRSARTEPFEVRPLETARPTLTLESGASLAVKVLAVDKDGGKFPLKGARVELRPERGFGGPGGGGRGGRGRGSEIAYNAGGGKGQAARDERVETTDAQGVAAFSVVEAGRWDAIVSYEGFSERRQSVQVSGDGVQTIVVELPTEKAKVNLRLVSTLGYDLPEGRVLVTRRRVFFRGPGRQAAGGGGSVEVDVKNGRAELELDYGTWFFQGTAEKHQTTTLSDIAIEEPGPIELVLSMPPLLEITAHLTRLGQPVAGAPVTFFSRAESTFGPNIATTDAEGIARYEAAPGSYAVYVNRRYVDAVEARLDSDNFFELKLDGFVVDGYVRDAETSAGIDRATVRLVQQLDAGDEAATIPSVFRDPRGRSNGEGYFSLNEVGQGLYALEVIADGYASLVTDPFEVNEQTSGVPTTWELKKASGKIAGFIRRPDGSPVAGVIPRQLFNESMTPYPVNYRDAVSREDGAYEIDNLEPGLYIVQFSGQPWRGQNYIPQLTDAIEVKAGETSPLDVSMEPAGSLRVSARDLEGIAVPGVALSLVGSDGSSLAPWFVDSPEPVSDVAGEFHWTEIPPGAYRLYGSGTGVRQAGEPVSATIEADATARATVVLERVN